MIGPLNHVGVAVPSLEDAVDTYKKLYGVTDITEPGEMIDQGVRYCFVNFPNSQIELIEPLGDNSPINNFLEKKRHLLKKQNLVAGRVCSKASVTALIGLSRHALTL